MFVYIPNAPCFVSENAINYAVYKVLMMNVVDIWMDFNLVKILLTCNETRIYYK